MREGRPPATRAVGRRSRFGSSGSSSSGPLWDRLGTAGATADASRRVVARGRHGGGCRPGQGPLGSRPRDPAGILRPHAGGVKGRSALSGPVRRPADREGLLVAHGAPCIKNRTAGRGAPWACSPPTRRGARAPRRSGPRAQSHGRDCGAARPRHVPRRTPPALRAAGRSPGRAAPRRRWPSSGQESDRNEDRPRGARERARGRGRARRRGPPGGGQRRKTRP